MTEHPLVAHPPTIAIDGPSASGKSTLARAVARTLGWVHADTGSLYRSIAYSLIRSGLEEAPDEIRCRHVLALGIRYVVQDGGTRVFLGDRDVSSELRTEEVGRLASSVSQLPCVREALLRTQRDLADKGHVVMDGRDIGTIILPEATLKVFLVADPKVRAERRRMELESNGVSLPLDAVLKEIQTRDSNDRNRALAPLVKAPDALELDNSRMTVEESVRWILERLPR